MTTSTHLLARRRFLPLFVTQMLGAFNDNLFKNVMLLFVVYSIYDSARAETQFNAIASGLFILPFMLFSALAGQFADTHDKARLARIVKLAEVAIMLVGAAGLLLAWQGQMRHDPRVHSVAIPLMLAALTGMGLHSTFFGPIKYAILPQHLRPDEVLAGTGLIEAGTYIAILAGTILAGILPVEWAALAVVVTALVGLASSRHIPPAPPSLDIAGPGLPLLGPVFDRAKRAVPSQPLRLVLYTLGAPLLALVVLADAIAFVDRSLHQRRIFIAIAAISFFWTIGAVLFIQFPPLAKNVLFASRQVVSLFLAIFSVGVAIGSVSINALLKGKVSARYAPAAVLAMAGFVIAFERICAGWTPLPAGMLLDVPGFIGATPMAWPLLLTLFGIAVAGGIFVVPLYAFLTTTVDKAHTARTIAANNIVNALAMVVGAGLAGGLSALGVPIVSQLLLSAAMCLVSAWLGWLLYRCEADPRALAR